MKKLVFTIVFSLFLCYQSMAQIFVQRDQQESLFNREKENEKGHGGDNPDPDPGVPLGSGLLMLTGLSAGYVCIKRSRKEDD